MKKNQNMFCWLFAALIWCCTISDGYAQNRNLTGNVTDSDGNPIPGVSVSIPGTTSGTITDIDGNYVISLNPEAKQILFSFIGMKSQTIEIGTSTTINAVLESDMVGMDEVVVVGYGVQKKSDITGSVISVDKDILESRASTNLEQLLQGSAAGMRITVNGSSAEGSSNSMLIRGSNSISASNSPLIIFDGIPFAGGMSEINTNDVESIEILKDASSAAIYGARGSNGVILITSKKGVGGKMSVNYEASYGVVDMVNVPDLMDGKTFYETKIGRGLSTSAVEDEGYESGRNTDWVDLATRTGSLQQHNLSFRGGTERTKYYISTAYLDSKGVAKGDDFKRYTFRLNFDHKFLPWITYSTNSNYGYFDRSGSSASFGDAFSMNPLGIPYEEDGSYTIETWDDGVYVSNPLSPLLYDNSSITRRFTTNNSLLFNIPFIKGLTYNLKTGYDFRSKLNQTYRGRDTRSGASVNGSLSVDNEYDEDWIVENIISYKRKFNKHSIFLTGLYSAQSEWAERHNIDAEGFPNDVMSYYQASSGSLIEPSSSYTKKTHISQMLRANYAYDSRYLLTLTARRDGYSAFGDDTKFGIFPSVALGWNMANEQFMNNIDLVDVLKLRLSYGVNGNEAISAYSTLPTLSSREYVDADDNTLFGYYPSKLGDPTLGWETTTSFNTGIDFGLLGNRIRGTIDAYWSNTTDLLLKKSISDVNGIGSITQNIGETKNRGIEFQVSTVNVHSGDFKWTSDFNIAHNETEIVHVGLTDENGNYIDDVDNKWFIGEDIDVNYHYVFDGIYQEDMNDTPQGDVTAGDIRYLDADGDGEITPDDKRIIGSRTPDFVAGFTNTFQYKNWTLSFFLNAVVGITKANELLYTNDNSLRLNRYDVTFWTAENQSNEYPRNDEHAKVNKYSMPFYRNADFLRLQDISLSYKLPKSAISRFKLDRVEIFGNIKNLATWTEWEGLDPEFSDQTSIPQTATYLMGVKVNF